MAEYQLFAGKSTLPLGPKGAEKTFKEGDKVETDLKLDEMWPEKWARTENAPVPRRGKKAAPKAKAAPKPDEEEEPAEEEAEVDPDVNDVTDQFDLAKDNDLKVTHVHGTGYTIHDGKKAIHEEPLRSKTQVNARLKEHVGG